MSGVFSRAAAALSAGVLLALAPPALAASYSFETVALSGQPVPGLPGVTWSSFGAPSLNAAGDTAFGGFLTGAGVSGANNSAIARGGPGSLGLVARTGDAAPGAGGAAFSGLGSPALNAAGDTAFGGALSGAGVTGVNDGGIFAEDGGTLGLVARTGDAAPGTGGATFSFFNAPALSAAGDTAFLGTLTGTGVTAANDRGIFAEDGGALGLFTREGDAAPGAGGAVFSDFGNPALNAAGDTAFRGGLTGTGVTSANDFGIFAEDGGTLGLVARKGDAAPGTGGAVFSSFSGATALNAAGDTAFSGSLAGAGVTAVNDRGIFAELGGTLGLVARAGDQVEVLPGDLRTITFLTLAEFGFLNDSGQLAFQASFSDGSRAILLASLEEAQVPLPPSALLLLGALGLIGLRARRPA